MFAVIAAVLAVAAAYVFWQLLFSAAPEVKGKGKAKTQERSPTKKNKENKQKDAKKDAKKKEPKKKEAKKKNQPTLFEYDESEASEDEKPVGKTTVNIDGKADSGSPKVVHPEPNKKEVERDRKQGFSVVQKKARQTLTPEEKQKREELRKLEEDEKKKIAEDARQRRLVREEKEKEKQRKQEEEQQQAASPAAVSTSANDKIRAKLQKQKDDAAAKKPVPKGPTIRVMDAERAKGSGSERKWLPQNVASGSGDEWESVVNPSEYPTLKGE